MRDLAHFGMHPENQRGGPTNGNGGAGGCLRPSYITYAGARTADRRNIRPECRLALAAGLRERFLECVCRLWHSCEEAGCSLAMLSEKTVRQIHNAVTVELKTLSGFLHAELNKSTFTRYEGLHATFLNTLISHYGNVDAN